MSFQCVRYSALSAPIDWRRKAEGATCDYGFHMAITWWDRQVFDEMETIVKTYGINTFKHFMAYKGALMVNDDELYNSFLRCAGLGAMPLVNRSAVRYRTNRARSACPCT